MHDRASWRHSTLEVVRSALSEKVHDWPMETFVTCGKKRMRELSSHPHDLLSTCPEGAKNQSFDHFIFSCGLIRYCFTSLFYVYTTRARCAAIERMGSEGRLIFRRGYRNVHRRRHAPTRTAARLSWSLREVINIQ
jgi:hypothetical protein